MTTIAILSPGAMGSALGRCWSAGGARVVATTAGRSARTQSLATGLELLPDLAAVIAAADVVVSVVPPDSAIRVAEQIAAQPSAAKRPLVVDLNAIAPSTVTDVQHALGGLELVDGAISGRPPEPDDAGSTIVYLSGARAVELAEIPMPGVQLRVVGPDLGSASAVKMCTASIYKGLTALFAQALQTADRNGVTELVLADLVRNFPDEVADAARSIAVAASKSDRYPGEMRQIAIAQAAAGGEGALFEGMASVYEAMNRSALATLTPEQAAEPVELAEVLRLLAQR